MIESYDENEYEHVKEESKSDYSDLVEREYHAETRYKTESAGILDDLDALIDELETLKTDVEGNGRMVNVRLDWVTIPAISDDDFSEND